MFYIYTKSNEAILVMGKFINANIKQERHTNDNANFMENLYALNNLELITFYYLQFCCKFYYALFCLTRKIRSNLGH